MDKLAGGDVRLLRPVAPPSDQPTEPRYEIFHDVLAPAVLDWRTRYVQEQERAERQRELQQAKVSARRAKAALAWTWGLLLSAVLGVAGWLIHTNGLIGKIVDYVIPALKAFFESPMMKRVAKIVALALRNLF